MAPKNQWSRENYFSLVFFGFLKSFWTFKAFSYSNRKPWVYFWSLRTHRVLNHHLQSLIPKFFSNQVDRLTKIVQNVTVGEIGRIFIKNFSASHQNSFDSNILSSFNVIVDILLEVLNDQLENNKNKDLINSKEVSNRLTSPIMIQFFGSAPSGKPLMKKYSLGFPITVLWIPHEYSRPFTKHPGPTAISPLVL